MSQNQSQASKQRQKFQELLSEADAAMLVTSKPDGALKARPMMLLESTERGEMRFLTGRDTDKVDDIDQDAHVCVTFQKSSAFLSVSGRATLEDDRAQIRRLWTKASEAWFEGPDDPSAVLIRVQADAAEYWDNRGLNGVKYVFEAVRAVVQGDRPRTSTSQHGSVRVP